LDLIIGYGLETGGKILMAVTVGWYVNRTDLDIEGGYERMT
jgi:hypothetical protein